MKTVKLNGVMLDLKGMEIKNPAGGGALKMNEFVANLLAFSKGDNALRKLSIAQAMYLDGDMELEDADYKLVKKIVDGSDTSAILLAQVLTAMGVTE